MSLRGYDYMIACISLAVCVLTAAYWIDLWWLMWLSGVFAALFFVLGYRNRNHMVWFGRRPSSKQEHAVKGICLLSEENKQQASWDLFGRTSLVIGRDVGENKVGINLSGVTYESFIETEHAVLNYAGNQWYIEDLYSQNGVMVQKQGSDLQYRLGKANPCKIGVGDLIYIANTKMMVQ